MTDTIFILDEHLKTKSVLTINGKNTFFNDTYSMTLDDCTETYQFETNITDIDESCYVMFRYHNQYKLFQITEIEQTHEEGMIISYIYSECACLELLNSVVRPFSGEFNVISFFRHILEDGTGWAIGDYSSRLADKVVNVKIDKTTQIWSVITDCMADFGYEINTRCIYENGHVKSKVIDIYDELGNKTYKRFEYGRNINSITKKKSLYDFATALILDTDKEIVDLEYNQDGYVKSKGSDVIFATNENEQYNLGKSYIYGVHEDNDSQSGQEVIEKAVESLKTRAVPHFDYEVTNCMTVDEINSINLGDTVYVIDHTFNPIITLEARVGELEISFSDRNNNRCNLSNYKEVKSKIKSFDVATVMGELKNYIDGLQVGTLDMAQIEQLRLYLTQLGIEKTDIDRIVARLNELAGDVIDKDNQNKVEGEYIDILINDSSREYICDRVKSMQFRLPTTTLSTELNTRLEFTTEKDTEPTKFYQSTVCWLVGDHCVNGALILKPDTTYSIAIEYDGKVKGLYDYYGTVTATQHGGSYSVYTNKTDYLDKINEVMQTYYDNRSNFTYNTTTIYSFKDPTTPTNQAKWQTNGKFHIDCSTFVQLALRGIKYEESTYANPTVSPYFLSDKYTYPFVLDATISDRDRFASDQARYCVENGYQLDIDITNQANWGQLQVGDIVFWNKRMGDVSAVIDRYMQVGHVAIVSSVEGNTVYTMEVTTLSNTVIRRSLADNYPDKLIFVARPRR